METITLTFGEMAENHKGMQIIGKKASKGLSTVELLQIKNNFEKLGYKSLIYNLNTIPKKNDISEQDFNLE